MNPKCNPHMSANEEATTLPFVKQEKSIKQKEQIELYHALFEIHKRAMEIDKIVSDLAAKNVLESEKKVSFRE